VVSVSTSRSWDGIETYQRLVSVSSREKLSMSQSRGRHLGLGLGHLCLVPKTNFQPNCAGHGRDVHGSGNPSGNGNSMGMGQEFNKTWECHLASRHEWWTVLLFAMWLNECTPPSDCYEFNGAYWKTEFEFESINGTLFNIPKLNV